MENFEEESGEVINASTHDANVENISTVDTGPPNQAEDLNDSVEIIENPVEILDLTSPQPSTSSSNSAGAVGANIVVKRNLEDTFKENNTDQTPSTSASANSSNSSGNVLECPICLQTCIHPARLPCGHIFCFLCVKGVAYKNRRCAMCRREIPPEFLDHPQLVNGIEDICTTKATDDGYQWFYEGRNGGWWAYEKRNASEIEAAFQIQLNNKFSCHQMLLNVLKTQIKVKKEENNTLNVTNDTEDETNEIGEGEANDDDPFTYNIQICGNTYTVDFQNMIQYPKDMPYRKRKICRAKGLPAKGVAGILTAKRNRRVNPY